MGIFPYTVFYALGWKKLPYYQKLEGRGTGDISPAGAPLNYTIFLYPYIIFL